MRSDIAVPVAALVLGAIGKAATEFPFREVAEFGSTAILGIFMIYFIRVYLPRQEQRSDAKDKLFFEELEKVRKEDAAERKVDRQEDYEEREKDRKEDEDRRHKANGELQKSFGSLEVVVARELRTLNEIMSKHKEAP